MKVKNSAHLNPFGGINFVFQSLDKLGVPKILADNLPKLAKQSKFDWKDILYSFWSIYFCGGDCIEDIGTNLKTHLKRNIFAKTPSPDRILNRFKELAKDTQSFKTPRSSVNHSFSINDKLNNLLIQIYKILKPSNQDELILDYDNTIIYTQKNDSTKTYRRAYGYQPGVGLIGNQVVYVENRNGNSNATALQKDTLERMFSLLETNEIKIDKFRADGASYQLKVIELLDEKVNKFYIRATVSRAIASKIALIDDWKEIKLKGEIAYRAEIKYVPFQSVKENNYNKECRVIITKVARKDNQINLFTKDAFLYRAIVTNDFEMTMDEVVYFYNQRGAIEKQFDILKNDFGWNNLPFSKLNQNCVFLILTAICNNLYAYIISSYSKKIKGLKATDRIKKFIFRFICIPAKWIKQSRQKVLKLYGNLNFTP